MLYRKTRSPEETRALADCIGRRLGPGDVLLLHGDLGAGKTTFVQGLAAGLGLSDPVTSPTFTLIHEYRGGPLPLIHLDPYRLSGAQDVEDLGFDELLSSGAVIVVEWAERLESLAPQEALEVRLAVMGEEEREVRLIPHGSRWEKLLREVESEC